MADRIHHALKVMTGNAHRALAKEICEHLGVPLARMNVSRFPDGGLLDFRVGRKILEGQHIARGQGDNRFSLGGSGQRAK